MPKREHSFSDQESSGEGYFGDVELPADMSARDRALLDFLLAATDDRETQKRIARALMLVPTDSPGH